MLEGVESEVDVLEWRGFQDGVELLFLGATEQTNQIERERERQREKYQAQINFNKIEKKWYVCMKNAWACDMQQ